MTKKRARGRAVGRKADMAGTTDGVQETAETVLESVRSMATMPTVPSDESSSSSEGGSAAPTKRRKLRKGTFSCTECKRRKVRCHFADGTARHSACVPCQRHGTRCVGQEYAAPSPSPCRSPDPSHQRQYRNVAKRIAQVEALVSELMRRRIAEGFSTSDSILQPRDDVDEMNEADERATNTSGFEDETADLFDQEFESILDRDSNCFSHWLNDRFMSQHAPRVRQLPTPAMMLASLQRSSGPDTEAIANDNDDDNESIRSLDLPLTTLMRLQFKQLEKEITANRLLFPARPALYTGPLEHQTLSKQLQSVLPTTDSALRIMNRGALFTLRRYRAFLSAGGSSQKEASALQKQNTGHPILFARELIQLAVCLQMMHKDSSLADLGLPGAAPWETANRYFEVACNLVTSQDTMVSSQEGLESLLLQAFFMVNKGDLRGGWMTLRRALGIAQLIGLPPPSWSNQPMSLYLVWTRLLFSERFLSLMMGLPSCNVEDHYRTSLSQPSANAAGWTENLVSLALSLERMHTLIIPRIAARNDRLNQFAQVSVYHSDKHQYALNEDYRETRDIDYAFRQAAQALPITWWAIPDLIGGKMGWAEQIEEIARLMSQAKHYHFLVLLHLPYLTDRRPGFLPAKPPRSPGVILPGDFVSESGKEEDNCESTDGVNFREFGAAVGYEATALPVADDIASAFGINSVVAKRVASKTATTTTMSEQEQSSSSPSPPSGWPPTLAATSSKTSSATAVAAVTTVTALPASLDTTFSRLGALGAAREVLSRFMMFRYCTGIISRCYACDFESFVASIAILLTHIDAHSRGRDNVIHYQRPSDLEAVDRAILLIEELAKITKDQSSGTRVAILQRLMAIENDAAAGAEYEIWTEEGTLGRGDGRVTADASSPIQTMSVPYFGIIHINRLSALGDEDNAVQTFWEG